MNQTGFDLVLDGNAAAGLLRDMFVLDVTSAQLQCATCATTQALGVLRLYAASMGAVLRCNHCYSIVMRAVHSPHGRWLDLTGARYVRF